MQDFSFFFSTFLGEVREEGVGFIFMCALNLCCSDGEIGNAYTKEVLHDPGTSLRKKSIHIRWVGTTGL